MDDKAVSDTEFCLSILAAIAVLGSIEAVSIACDVSLPTVRRWAEGRNTPHQLMRPGLISALKIAMEKV